MKATNKPAFSVLMSVYKDEHPEYLDQAIKSIEIQTLLPKEIILVEDGPIGVELEKVIQEHKKKFPRRFEVIKLTNNQGLGKALNIGTKYVTTDWIARMDTDDICVKERFQIQVKQIVNEPELAVIGGQINEFIDSVNNVVGYRKVPLTSTSIKKYLKWRSPFNHPTVIINKKKLVEVGGYQSFGTFEDYYLWSRMIIENEKVANSPKVLVHMRVSDALYERRGNPKNIKYVLRLQKFMYQNGLVNGWQFILGTVIKVFNILISGKMRKIIYQGLIHKKNN